MCKKSKQKDYILMYSYFSFLMNNNTVIILKLGPSSATLSASCVSNILSRVTGCCCLSQSQLDEESRVVQGQSPVHQRTDTMVVNNYTLCINKCLTVMQ